jgi:hypothetical protein
MQTIRMGLISGFGVFLGKAHWRAKLQGRRNRNYVYIGTNRGFCNRLGARAAARPAGLILPSSVTAKKHAFMTLLRCNA